MATNQPTPCLCCGSPNWRPVGQPEALAPDYVVGRFHASTVQAWLCDGCGDRINVTTPDRCEAEERAEADAMLAECRTLERAESGWYQARRAESGFGFAG
jgi:hypothetical protein